MESALLYTFSTIPQTVGAALAVLAAFVLYRLQSDSSTLWQDASLIISEFGPHHPTAVADPPTNLGDLLGRQQYKKLLLEFNALYAGRPPEVWGERRLAHKRITTSLEARDKIHAALSWAFGVTAIVIVGSVIELALAHRTAAAFWLIGAAVLSLGVLGLALCLWLYWLLIRAALWSE